MNKIKDTFNKKGLNFIGYLTVGYPDYKTSLKWAEKAISNGVDILEIGVPFSDPVADGITIQHASHIALQNGMNKQKLLNWIIDFRKKNDTPLIVMSYYNPIYHNGNINFIKQLHNIGVNGIILPDLPYVEGKEIYKKINTFKMATPMLIPPNISHSDIPNIVNISSGFIYIVSKTGTTGETSSFHSSLIKLISNIKTISQTPVALGFGISNSSQIDPFRDILDGIIVGSNLINRMENNLELSDWIAKIKGSK